MRGFIWFWMVVCLWGQLPVQTAASADETRRAAPVPFVSACACELETYNVLDGRENLIGKIFYREAGDWRRPTIVLLHGLPTSSHMFRDLIGRLSDRFHVLAPDYPGFGNSDAPDPDCFDYTFNHLSLVIERFLENLGVDRLCLYMHGAGVPVGLRICKRHPGWIGALIVQNGNAYEDGYTDATKPWFDFWRNRTAETEAAVKRFTTREGIVWQYIDGVRHRERISPDAWNMDWVSLSRPGNGRIQLELLYDYRKNLEEYSRWQAYFREHQPPMLVLWGRNDPVFSFLMQLTLVPQDAKGQFQERRRGPFRWVGSGGGLACDRLWQHIERSHTGNGDRWLWSKGGDRVGEMVHPWSSSFSSACYNGRLPMSVT